MFTACSCLNLWFSTICILVLPVNAYIIVGSRSPNGIFHTNPLLGTSPHPLLHTFQPKSHNLITSFSKQQKIVHYTATPRKSSPKPKPIYTTLGTSPKPYLHQKSTTYVKPYLLKPIIYEPDLYPQHNVGLQKKIERYHNEFRTQVQPTASNMLYMRWNVEAARQAQKYAEVCKFVEHNSWKDRIIKEYGSCGQNLFGSQVKTDWYTAIESWFSEYVNFTYGSHNNVFPEIGHYTQMVWATSHQVGCGVAFCKGGPWGQFYNYVCHYCPSGNYDYNPYKIGQPCGDCPYDCVWGSLCTNSCPSLDALGNCEELLVEPDICYTGECNATCFCGDKIYKNYPWV